MKLFKSLAAIALSSAVAACVSGEAKSDSLGVAGGSSAATIAHDGSAHADSIRADSISRARQDSINRAQPGYVIDSILPVEEEMRRFRAQLGGDSVTSLQNASRSRDALVSRIVNDVASGDSIDLAKTAISPREFIDLVYPSSPYTHPPYRQPPAIAWLLISNRSESGYKRLIRRRGEGGLRLVDYSCNAKPEIQGNNRLWTGCSMRLENEKGEYTTQRWFGSILERDGRFKIMSFSNQF